ncbi:MAG: DUF87 domain-containing protein [Acidobacteriota bacterium]
MPQRRARRTRRLETHCAALARSREPFSKKGLYVETLLAKPPQDSDSVLKMTRLIPQRLRFILLLAYLVLLCVLSFVALGVWIPPFDGRGLWLYSGVYAFLVGALLESPTHVRPAQAFSFSALAALGILGIGLSGQTELSPTAETVLGACLALEVGILASAALAMLLYGRTSGKVLERAGKTGYLLSSSLGRPGIVSFPPFLFAIVAFHSNSARESLLLTLGWSVLVFARPLDWLVDIVSRLSAVWGVSSESLFLGTVIGHSVPGVLTIRQRGTADVEPGTALLVPGEDGIPNVAMALNYVGKADGLWLKALQLDLSPELKGKIPSAIIAGDECARISDANLISALEAGGVSALRDRYRLIGLVAPGTDTKTLHVEVVRTGGLSEGSLLQVKIGHADVLYQLLDGFTKEDILERKSTRGFVLAKARKIGTWDEDSRGFKPVKWVPEPNTPVFRLSEGEGPEPDGRAVGYFPRTSYPVRVSTSDLVTHNTAVLGILGVGKTFLALELVERVILGDVRVIVIDLTNEYENELTPYVDADRQERVVRHLQEIGTAGKTNVQRNVEAGGSIQQFASAVNELVERFLEPTETARMLTINPNMFEVWRQDSKPYNDQASMATLTAAEITRIFSEAALEAVQKQGMVEYARCCLVYEEAHSLVPEWNAVAYEGDKAAANGTARAILQGRKFGLGCLLVTQRTASVTKTILNQCNTVFAMRVFDATGMGFLANYIGEDYADVLSSLPDRHAVVFGKASSCSDPVLIRANERSAFLQAARETRPEVWTDHSEGR